MIQSGINYTILSSQIGRTNQQLRRDVIGIELIDIERHPQPMFLGQVQRLRLARLGVHTSLDAVGQADTGRLGIFHRQPAFRHARDEERNWIVAQMIEFHVASPAFSSSFCISSAASRI